MHRKGTKGMSLGGLMPVNTEAIVRESIRRRYVKSCGTSYIAEDLTRLKKICQELDIPFSTPVQLLVKDFIDWFDNPKNKAKILSYIAKIRSESDDAKINKKKVKI